jgi:hypothetical protein
MCSIRLIPLSLAAALSMFAAACSSPTEPDPALQGGVVAVFETSGERFSVFVRNPTAVQRLIQIRDGARLGQIPNGRIRRGPGAANRNAPHPWHLAPDQIEIVDAAAEVCDGAPSYVDTHVDEYVDVVGYYCPWGAKLVRLEDYR